MQIPVKSNDIDAAPIAVSVLANIKHNYFIYVFQDSPIFAGGNDYNNDPYSIRTYGYSASSDNLCLELCASKPLANLLNTSIQQVQSVADVEALIRQNGKLHLWWRTLDSTRAVSCQGDGNYANYY